MFWHSTDKWRRVISDEREYKLKARPYTVEDLEYLTESTIENYDEVAKNFATANENHDVSQNYEAMLGAVRTQDGPVKILDLGCGPGRDLKAFKDMGHDPVGLDGTKSFVEMARKESGCEVLHQQFLKLNLPVSTFDCVFANAVFLHIPRQELSKVLRQLRKALKSDGVLFCSTLRGNAEEVGPDGRFRNKMELDILQPLIEAGGFEVEHHYFRPKDAPKKDQRWLAVVSRVKG